MLLVLALFPILLIVQDGFGYAVGLGTRLSGKNVLIFAALLLIALRMVRESRLRLELPAIQVYFVLLIGYAIMSWWVAAFVVQYDQYKTWYHAVLLKMSLVDYFLIFLAFFYGPRTQSEVASLLRVLLLVVTLAHVFTVGEWAGVLGTSFAGHSGHDRMDVFFSQVNQYALIVVLFLPAMAAEAGNHGRPGAAFWISAVALSLLCLLLTASRGGAVALLAAALSLAVVYRHSVSATQAVRAVAIGVLIFAVVATSVVALQYEDRLYERVVLETLQAGNIWDASSGRTGLWLAALDRMTDHPLALITGYGWQSYFYHGFALAPHNTYVDTWFNLGLPGLFCLVGLLTTSLIYLYRAGVRASGAVRAQLHAAMAGVIGVMVGLFFAEWAEPWLYFWVYLGLALRMAVLATAEAEQATAGELKNAVNIHREKRDYFGWTKGRAPYA